MADVKPSGLWCAACQGAIFAGDRIKRIGGTGQYVHVVCPEVRPKENTMATPVKPAVKPVAKPAVVKPAPAPAKPAAVAKPAPAKVAPKPAVTKPAPAPAAEAPAEVTEPKKRGRAKREGPAYADITLADYAANTINFGPKARDEAGNPINPKRGKSAERFALYQEGMTVTQAMEAGISVSDMRWDLAHEFITLA